MSCFTQREGGREIEREREREGESERERERERASIPSIQGYLAHTKTPCTRTLQ